ncbi:hypothetical protein ACHQM5_009322 [Ranunculus cassubicifolius]
MAGICTKETESEVKCNPQEIFEMLKHSLHHLPTIFPDVYKHGQVVEGDEKSLGCVRHLKYVLPGTSEVLSVHIKTLEMDNVNLTLAFEIVEGDLTDHFKHFVARIQVTPKGEGCTVKWIIEYEKHNDEVLDPDNYLGMCVLLNEILDRHLHKP